MFPRVSVVSKYMASAIMISGTLPRFQQPESSSLSPPGLSHVERTPFRDPEEGQGGGGAGPAPARKPSAMMPMHRGASSRVEREGAWRAGRL
jgi:hypothetical protein